MFIHQAQVLCTSTLTNIKKMQEIELLATKPQYLNDTFAGALFINSGASSPW